MKQKQLHPTERRRSGREEDETSARQTAATVLKTDNIATSHRVNFQQQNLRTQQELSASLCCASSLKRTKAQQPGGGPRRSSHMMEVVWFIPTIPSEGGGNIMTWQRSALEPASVDTLADGVF